MLRSRSLMMVRSLLEYTRLAEFFTRPEEQFYGTYIQDQTGSGTPISRVGDVVTAGAANYEGGPSFPVRFRSP
jgi:hypothetical protein